MQKFIKSETLATGCAMFAMFFGAGNIIFPLVVGQFAGSQNNFMAILGLLMTAVIMPFAGVFAMVLYDGDYRTFFGRIGRLPGFIATLTILTLLGPLGSIPRCIALSYSTLKSSFPGLSSVAFSACACFLIYVLTVKKSRLIDLLGKWLTPCLLFILALIIIKGLFTPSNSLVISESSQINFFWHGLKEGYNTMDLMAAFFFSASIISILKNRAFNHADHTKNYLKLTLKASLIGASLLATVYIGFSYVAAFHAQTLQLKQSDELLSALTINIIGTHAGYLAFIAISLACLTTAIALSAVFTDFIQKEVFKNRVSFARILAGSLIVTFFVSTFEFNGISLFLGPILETCYPFLIALTFYNIIFYKQNKASLN